MSATITTQQTQMSQLDALWTLFLSQSKTVRKAFTQRLMQHTLLSAKNAITKSSDAEIMQLDSMLYGSIKLPEDFDYDKELEKSLKEKYLI